METAKSQYYKALSGDVKLRYEAKIIKCDGIDPYSLKQKDLSVNREDFPEITLLDIGNYMIYSVSAYTKRAFKSYKSLEAYSFFRSGFVLSVGSINISNAAILLGKVKHSQRMNESPLIVWILANMDGNIICGHCTCIAGLSETCSHIGAICFAVMSIIESSETETVTSVLCKWNVPSYKKVSMNSAENINWKASSQEDQTPLSRNSDSSFLAYVDSLTTYEDEDITDFINGIHSDGEEPALRTILYPNEIRRKTNITDEAFLASLYNESNIDKTHCELVEMGKLISLRITNYDVDEIALLTLPKHKSKFWIGLRRGRITGSNFKHCCLTNIENPPISTINRLINPIKNLDTFNGTKYQTKHKKAAIAEYVKEARVRHANFEYQEHGLIVNSKTPYFSASSDGFVSCDCHRVGCVTIKFFKILDSGESFDVLTRKPNNILNKSRNQYSLEKSHELFYNAQMQINLAELNYCDLLIWSLSRILVIKVNADFDFWNLAKAKALNFHEQVVMPELLGKYYTRADSTNLNEENFEFIEKCLEIDEENLELDEEDLDLVDLEIEFLNSEEEKYS